MSRDRLPALARHRCRADLQPPQQPPQRLMCDHHLSTAHRGSAFVTGQHLVRSRPSSDGKRQIHHYGRQELVFGPTPRCRRASGDAVIHASPAVSSHAPPMLRPGVAPLQPHSSPRGLGARRIAQSPPIRTRACRVNTCHPARPATRRAGRVREAFAQHPGVPWKKSIGCPTARPSYRGDVAMLDTSSTRAARCQCPSTGALCG